MADLKYTVDLDFSNALQTAAEVGKQIGAKLGEATEKVAAVKLGVDPGSVDRVRKVVGAVNNEIKKGGKGVDDIRKAWERKRQAVKKSVGLYREQIQLIKKSKQGVTAKNRGLKITNKLLEKQKQKLREIQGIQRQINTSIGRGKQKASGMGGVFAGFVGKFTAAGLAIRAIEMGIAKIAEGIGAVVGRAQKMSELSTALSSFISGQEDIAAVMAHAKATAMAYGVSLEGVEKSWKRVGPAANAAGLSMGQTSKLIEAVSARTAQMGLNAEQTGRYMEAVAQVMGKNKLQSEELTQQFSELDGALRSQLAAFFEAEYGITDLGEAMKKGEIDARMFGEGMIAVSEGAMKNMINDAAQLTQNIKDMSFNQVINQINTLQSLLAEKASGMFAPLAQGLAESYTAFLAWFASFEKRFPALYNLISNTMGAIGHSISLGLKLTVAFLELTAQAIEWVLQKLRDLPGPVKAILTVLNPTIGAIAHFAEQNNWLSESMANADAKATAYLDTIHNVGEIMEEQQQKAQDMIDRRDAEANSAEALAQKMEKEGARRQALAQGIQQLIEKHQASKGATDSAALSSGNVALALQNEKMSTEDLIESIEKLAQARQKSQAAAIDKEFKAKKAAIDAELRDIEKLKDAEKDRHETALRGIQAAKDKQADLHRETMRDLEDEKTALQRKKQASKAYYDQAMAKERARHQAAIRNLEAEERRINKKYDDRIDRAQDGPAQQRYNQLKMQELRMKSRSSEYTRLERAEFRAQVEDMQNAVYIKQQEQARERELAKVAEQKRIEEQRHEEEMARLQKERDDVQKRIARSLEQVADAMREQKRKNEDINGALGKQKRKEDDIHKANISILDTKKDQLQEQKRINNEQKQAAKEANTVEKHIRDIASETKTAAGQMSRFSSNTASAAWSMERLAKWSQQVKAPPTGRWSGGPVEGGQKYQVNELGKEGFMTASGSIKPINVAKNGMWRAPQNGTVIPAHIFKDLNVPATGLKASQPSGSNNAGAGSQRALLKALSGVSGSSNVTNNVTIQSSNTNKTASDMLVTLTRIKRRRYH